MALTALTSLAAAQSNDGPDGADRLLTSLEYFAEGQVTTAGGTYAPLWLNANKHGLSSTEKQNGYARFAALRPLEADSARRWAVGYALDVALGYGQTSTFVVQQAYVDVRWLKGLLTVGAKELPMELKNNELSTGSQCLGINARPVPQVRIALPDYWDIPGLGHWLGLKGHVAYGIATDNNWQKDFTQEKSRRTENTLLHTKAGYLRIGNREKTRLQVELGLEMAAQFGGTAYFPSELKRPDGTFVTQIDNPVTAKDFLKVFFPMGNDQNEGVYANKQGNQLGAYLARITYTGNNWEVSVYGDHFFEDHSQMFFVDYDGYGQGVEYNEWKKNRYVLYELRDILVGAEARLPRNPVVDRVVCEYVYTKYQSGPVYHDRSQTISDHVGGRDDYYNHTIFTGWQHWGQVMGNPLFLSPVYNTDGSIYVKNNRFRAWHVALSGTPTANLYWRLLLTTQKGWGTYNLPFADPKTCTSLLCEATWKPGKVGKSGWALTAAFAMDRGRLRGNNAGAQLTVRKTGSFFY